MNLHVGPGGGPFKTASLPLFPVKVGIAFARALRPERLDIDAFRTVTEDSLVIDIVQSPGVRAALGGTDNHVE